MNRHSNAVVMMALTIPTLLSAVSVLALGKTASGRENDDDLVTRFLASGAPVLESYQATRYLEATARNGKMRATLEATTRLENGRFSFDVTGGGGSGLLKGRVLQRALEEEQRTINEGRSGQAALTPVNYRFSESASDDEGLISIGITPLAPANMLLDGFIRVSPTGDLVSVEGRLSRSPSFWTRRVDVERRYARLEGVRVPTLMRSRAQVRVVGTGTFEMRYRYVRINGRPVEAP